MQETLEQHRKRVIRQFRHLVGDPEVDFMAVLGRLVRARTHRTLQEVAAELTRFEQSLGAVS